MDNLIRARKAVVDTYAKDGYYTTSILDKIMEGEHDETFVIRAIMQALDNLDEELFNLRAA